MNKISRYFLSSNKKVKTRNIFSNKNKLETPQLLFCPGVGTFFIGSQRLIILSKSINQTF